MKTLLRMVVVGLLLALAGCDRHGDSGPNDREAIPSSPSAPSVELTGWVTDAADILSPWREKTISAKLEQFQKQTNHQLVVATVPTLAGKEVAAFTKNLANSWGIGRKDHNDGVVLLVAPNERKIRIAVGYGLEAVLTKAICQQIIDESIIPSFRNDDLPGGIETGVDALISRLQ